MMELIDYVIELTTTVTTCLELCRQSITPIDLLHLYTVISVHSYSGIYTYDIMSPALYDLYDYLMYLVHTF